MIGWLGRLRDWLRRRRRLREAAATARVLAILGVDPVPTPEEVAQGASSGFQGAFNSTSAEGADR